MKKKRNKKYSNKAQLYNPFLQKKRKYHIIRKLSVA